MTRKPPGSPPGVDQGATGLSPPPAGTVRIHCIDYGPERIEDTEVMDLEAFLQAPRGEWAVVRWINVDGLDPWVIDRFRVRFGVHTLAAEDVLNPQQRPKVESYPDHLFVTLRMFLIQEGEVMVEQVSLLLFPDTVITFQERPGDVWEPIRARIRTEGSRIRQRGADYALYTLLDSIIDHCFPLLEHYGDELEEMEEAVVERPEPDLLRRLHQVKRELALMRRLLWPTREMLGTLLRDEPERLGAETEVYLRDVHDHAIQVVDIIETYREMAAGLVDLYLSSVSNRMNEVMKVLTVMASFFIPITFVAGVYGMNFEDMPELGFWWAYPAFWLVCLSVTGVLFLYFRRKDWL